MSDVQRIEVTSLAQLNDRVTVNIAIERPGGVELIIPLREVDWQDWLNVEFDYPVPKAPTMGADKSGRPIYNNSDPTYVKSVNEVIEKRDYARLLMALQIDVPGETDEDRMAELGKMPATVIRTLRLALNDMHAVSEARVDGRADGFQHDSNTGVAAT